MMKRKLAAILSINLLAVSLMACNPDNPDTDETTTLQTTTAATEAATTEATSEDTTEAPTTEVPTTEETTTEATESEAPTTDTATEETTETATETSADGVNYVVPDTNLTQQNTIHPISWQSASSWTDFETTVGTTPTMYHYPFEEESTGFIMVQSAHVPDLAVEMSDNTDVLELFRDEIAAAEGITLTDSSISGSAGNELLRLVYTQEVDGEVFHAYGNVVVLGDYIESFIGFMHNNMTTEYENLINTVFNTVEVTGDPSGPGETDLTEDQPTFPSNVSGETPVLPSYTLDGTASLGDVSWAMDSTWQHVVNEESTPPLLYLYPFANTVDGTVMISALNTAEMDSTSDELLEQFYAELMADTLLENVHLIDYTGDTGSEVLTFGYNQVVNDSMYSAFGFATVFDGNVYYISGLIMGPEPSEEWMELITEIFTATSQENSTPTF